MAIDREKEFANAMISRNWLETQSLANFKAIASELYITPVSDKKFSLPSAEADATRTKTLREQRGYANREATPTKST